MPRLLHGFGKRNAFARGLGEIARAQSMRRVLRRVEAGGDTAAFDDRVDALRVERRDADLTPFVDAPKHRPTVDLRKFEPGAQGVDRTADDERALAGLGRRGFGAPQSHRQDRQSRPFAAPQDRPEPARVPRDRRPAAGRFRNAADPPEPKANKQQSAVPKIDRPSPPAGREQRIENVAGDRPGAFARGRAVSGADRKTQSVADGGIAERAFDAAPAMQRRPQREPAAHRGWRVRAEERSRPSARKASATDSGMP